MVAKIVGNKPPKDSYAVAYLREDASGIKKSCPITFSVQTGWEGNGVRLGTGLLVDLHGIAEGSRGLRATKATPVQPSEVS